MPFASFSLNLFSSMHHYKPPSPLDRLRLADRIENNFSAAYLTLVSIIQGVAFYFVMNNCMAVWKEPHQIWRATNGTWMAPIVMDRFFILYPITSFLSLVVVFYLYSYFVSVTFRPPSLRDCLFPMILGIFEVVPTFFFATPKIWWLWYFVFTVFAIVPLINTLCSLHIEHYDEEFQKAYKFTKHETIKNICISGLSGLIAVVAYWCYPSDKSLSEIHFGMADWLPLFLCLVLISLLLCLTEYSYLPRILRLFRLRTDSGPENPSSAAS